MPGISHIPYTSVQSIKFDEKEILLMLGSYSSLD